MKTEAKGPKRDGRELELKGLEGTHTVYRSHWRAPEAVSSASRPGTA